MDYLAFFAPYAPYAFFAAIGLLFLTASLLLRFAIKQERQLATRRAALVSR